MMSGLKSALTTTIYGRQKKTSTADHMKDFQNPRDEKDNRNPDFKPLLEKFKGAADKGFEELQLICDSIPLSSLKLDKEVDYYKNEFQFDVISEGLLPADIKGRGYRALKTIADGNCFFRSASILAFGNQHRHEEMRIRTVLELALNSGFYQKGNDVDKILLAEMQIYPKGGERRSKVSDEDVRREFESKVRNSAACSSWCGYWHLQALGTVLDRQIRSVYPASRENQEDVPKDEKDNEKPGLFSGGPIREETEKAEEGNSGLKKVKKDDLVAEIIYGNPCVMDELRLKLDFPVVKVPLKYWPHLAHILGASEKARKLCQQNSDYKPSARMFTHLSATSPSYTVAELKGVLKKIERSDLISVLENSSIKDTDRLTAISQREPNKFHEICLKLDCSKVNNWRDLGEAMCISEDILEKCERPGEYTEEVLKIIYTRQPELSMKEIKYALKEMNRGDVLEQLNKLPVESTIKILLNNAEVLQEFTRLLDKETPDGKNWQDFAQKFGVAKEECDYLCPVNGHSPTDLLMEYLSTAYPKLTLHTFMDALLQMDREDVVEESLKKFFDHIDIDVIKIKLHRLRRGDAKKVGITERKSPLHLL